VGQREGVTGSTVTHVTRVFLRCAEQGMSQCSICIATAIIYSNSSSKAFATAVFMICVIAFDQDMAGGI
jgi:hypothetical protein